MPIKHKKLLITGSSLTIKEIAAFVADPDARLELSAASFKAMDRAHAYLQTQMKKKVIYGVNTGFGPMASHIIGTEDMARLQLNLIRSHAVGIGEPIDQSFVLASMIVRLNTLAKGYSGISRELAERLALFINKRIIPVIPEHGAVGTSGDLVQLAHIALALIGEGEVWHEEKRVSTSQVLTALKIQPTYTLKPKEGLSLINGTSVMAGCAALVVSDAERILNFATQSGALALELVHAFDDSISEYLHRVRPHEGQQQIASALRRLLATSRRLRPRRELQEKIGMHKSGVEEISDDVQEVYSFRCIPQLLGPVWDILAKARREVEIEINSVTDNPIVDVAHDVILHGGNFHGDYIASAVDQLKISMVKLTILSERRINFFLNANVNKFFPPFLNLEQPGLTLALQGLQFVATSTTAQSQSLGFPHSLHSISTNADNQDVVSMGTDATLIAAKVIDNAYTLLTIELITLMQAVDILGIHADLCRSSRELFDSVRAHFPKITDDRVITHQTAGIRRLLKYGESGSMEKISASHGLSTLARETSLRTV